MSQALLKEETLPTITVERVPMLEGNGTLKMRKPLVLQTSMSQSGKYYEAIYDPLQVWATEEDFDQLEPAVLEIIAVMWETTAQLPDEKLAPRALKLKENLLSHLVIE